MALVLMAGVVQAQNIPNFRDRAKLRIAERLDWVIPDNDYCYPGTSNVRPEYGWDKRSDANLRLGGGKLYWAPDHANDSGVEIITADHLNAKLNGRNLLDVFENFVIRTYDFENWQGGGAVSYAVRFLDANNNLVTELKFWSDDVKIAPLRGIANKSESEINSIRKVVVKGNSSNGQVRIAEAYFISALPSTIDYTDKDGVDIGNAYIDPSYLIRSNRIWVDINEDDRSFYINLAAGNEFATLSFSLPYKTGIDMTDVTVVATDFFRSASPFNRCNYSNVRREMYNNADNTELLVRKLYNSRFNGPFYDENNYDALPNLGYPEKAMKHINDIHWEAFKYPTTELRRIWCQDICFTKNKIKARVTRKEMEPNDWTNQPEGFRNSDYPVRPYYRTPDNWSDVVRGWYEDEDMDVYTDLSKFDKMRIIGSPNTTFKIRFATSLNGNNVTKWEEIFVKTDAHGEVNIDLDVYPKFYLQAIHFDGLDVDGIRESIGNSDTDDTEMSEIRKTHYVNDIELFESEGRLVKLVGSNSPTEAGNMYHVWNDDNNYQWQYGTIVRWATNQNYGNSKFEEHYNEDLGSGALIWGTIGLYPENYADLTGYKAIRVYGTGSVRFVFNTTQNGTAQYGEKANTTATTNQDVVLQIGNKGYAEVDISNYEYFHLNGIKVPWGGNANITDIELVEDEEADYILYGNGSFYEQDMAPYDQSVWDAVNDPTAKVIDVRARCNNMQVKFDNDIFGGVEHLALPKTANPNVLYIERTDQFRGRKVGEHEEEDLTSDGETQYNDDGTIKMKTVLDYKNVNFIIPSNRLTTYEFTSNNIELTDGYSFYAPMKIKADEATYTRTFKNANVVNSIILPFAVNAGNNKEKNSAGFYETNVTLKSTTNQGKVGILEEQNVNEGDWLLQFSKKTGNTEANTPYLYAVTTGTGENVFEGVPTEDSKVIIPETPDVEVAAHLNMTNYDAATTSAKEGYYLRGVYEGTYMEDILFYAVNGTLYRTPYMTVTPFRTIIHSPVPVLDPDSDEYVDYKQSQNTYFDSGNVKVVLAFDPNDESMDINSLVADGLFAEDEPIYNVAGQRVNTFEKGIYIVGGKKILVK